jgi:hypothetical protein
MHVQCLPVYFKTLENGSNAEVNKQSIRSQGFTELAFLTPPFLGGNLFRTGI